MKTNIKARSCFGAAALFAIAVAAMPSAVQARPNCYYIAHHPGTGAMIADGNAWALKKSWACNRAQRRCNRELDRKKRKGLDRVALGARCRQAW
jgi:hypothetical protein